MKRVIIESPYAGQGRFPIVRAFRRWQNIQYARAALRDSLERGEAPIASHLLYTQSGVLDDDDPRERQWGIDAGLLWGLQAEMTVVYTQFGISRGMKYGIEAAEKAGRRIDYRIIPGWGPGK